MWLSGHTDLSLAFAERDSLVAGEDAPVTIEGKGLIEAFAWETEPGFAVHVLNYTNRTHIAGGCASSIRLGSKRSSFACQLEDVLRGSNCFGQKEIFHFTQQAIRSNSPYPRLRARGRCAFRGMMLFLKVALLRAPRRRLPAQSPRLLSFCSSRVLMHSAR